jgi:hypothetical protein
LLRVPAEAGAAQLLAFASGAPLTTVPFEPVHGVTSAAAPSTEASVTGAPIGVPTM